MMRCWWTAAALIHTPPALLLLLNSVRHLYMFVWHTHTPTFGLFGFVSLSPLIKLLRVLLITPISLVNAAQNKLTF